MPDIEFEVFRALIGYLYTGEAEVTPEMAAPLVLAAERYMVHALQLECVHVIVGALGTAAAAGGDAVGSDTAGGDAAGGDTADGGSTPCRPLYSLWDALSLASSLQLPPPADAPPGAPLPAETLREAALRLFCSAPSEVVALVESDEFPSHAAELVSRLLSVLRGRLGRLQQMGPGEA